MEPISATAWNSASVNTPKFRPYNLANFRQLPQIRRLPQEHVFAMEVVAQVLPFRANNYVVDQLIDWDRVPDDPMFRLTFPQREMLLPHHFDQMAAVLKRGGSPREIFQVANRIRFELNPHPAGQIDENVPELAGEPLRGLQHKYNQTVLFFPSQGQTCHAYCSFCFRWPQFVGLDDLKFASEETEPLIEYVGRHPEVTDVLFTGGDPLIMKTRVLASYIEPLLDAGLPNLRSLRIGTKALAYWPYRFLTDNDADGLMDLFRKVVDRGVQVAFMAHFSHPAELQTEAVQAAIWRIRETGAVIRTQSPLLAHINDDPGVWSSMWKKQVQLGCVPYYLFVARNTGAKHYFGVPLVRAWQIFRQAYKGVSGLARTVRGPSMSARPGKIQVLGVNEVRGERVITLRFLQGRNPDWVMRPFFARYDETATWIDDLRPAFGEEKFFFEESPAAASPVHD
jgi:KamA family protein